MSALCFSTASPVLSCHLPVLPKCYPANITSNSLLFQAAISQTCWCLWNYEVWKTLIKRYWNLFNLGSWNNGQGGFLCFIVWGKRGSKTAIISRPFKILDAFRADLSSWLLLCTCAIFSSQNRQLGTSNTWGNPHRPAVHLKICLSQ